MTTLTTADLVLAGGRVVDGTGGPERVADVAVADGRIVAVDALADVSAARVVDAAGLVVCPGFVDVHTHSDLTLLSSPAAHSAVRQGVTTQVIGNCGLGTVPVPPDTDAAALRAAVGFLDRDPAVEWRWRSLLEYLETLRAAQPAVNVMTLVGHVPLRAATVGFARRAATAAERDRMCGLLADGLAAGAAGLSTGMVYPPASYADEAELVALGRVVAEHDGVFAWHVRDYADGLLDSVAQALRVGEQAGCRTQISHLVVVGRRNWGAARAALDLVGAACERGLDVGVDVYPYLAGSTSLFQLMPGWAQEGGAGALLRRLGDPAVRERIRDELVGHPVGWDEIRVSRLPADDPQVVGATVADLAAARGQSGADVVMDLLLAYDAAVDMVAGGRCEDDLREVLAHPLTVVGSDGFALDPHGPTGSGMPHPRSYGTFPRLLADYTGEGGLPLPAAVAKCTGQAARRLGLTERGVVAPGYAADLVVFDPAVLRDRATFDAPQNYPDGVRLVVVNGEVVVEDDHTGARPGAVLIHRDRQEIGEQGCRVPR
ncbi:D-aminoacylase [Micromonospora sp. DR5-3]|uniref:N-acyl-D-amino-acid deacylase family protein n=1 Tax=unclassified Micromonospora TaxID=2617518 RepID=UPI0011D72F75|nr:MULTISPECIES: D-aminoacylase [unclassified Micromonospora]MCW3818913.1 D-aminoacylase [Micromonospora sp. DR5-3]TYC20937.1 D-aminoacylase [Micromonospora sp. MP36]